MATTGTNTPDTAPLQGLLGPQPTAEQASRMVQRGQETVVFALPTLARQRAQTEDAPSATPDPSAPSGRIPPHAKPAAKGRAEPKGGKAGPPGHRPAPTRVDRREGPTLPACPACHGPAQACGGSRTRLMEDIPAHITPLVTGHTIHRSWSPRCGATVEPTGPDALPGSTIGLRVAVLSARPLALLGTTFARFLDGLNFHLQVMLSPGGLIQPWRRLREELVAWHLENRPQALDGAVLHADETGWRVNGATCWLCRFAPKDVTYSMIDRRRGSPALKRSFRTEVAGVLVTDFWSPRTQPWQQCHARRLERHGRGSDDGAEIQAILVSVIRTLEQRGHEPVLAVTEAVCTDLRIGRPPPFPEPIAEFD